MPRDLAELIRARLGRDEEIGDFGDAWEAYDALRRAILVALEVHAPVQSDVGAPGKLVCACMPDPDDHYCAHPYPDRTLQMIARELGIEANDG